MKIDKLGNLHDRFGRFAPKSVTVPLVGEHWDELSDHTTDIGPTDDFYLKHGFRKSDRPFSAERTISRLKDINDRVKWAAKIVALGEDKFCENSDEGRVIRDTAERTVEVIAEAGAKLHSDYKLTAPDVDWGGLYGMKDKITHAYDQVDYSIVWEVMSEEIPKLNEQLSFPDDPQDDPPLPASLRNK